VRPGAVYLPTLLMRTTVLTAAALAVLAAAAFGLRAHRAAPPVPGWNGFALAWGTEPG